MKYEVEQKFPITNVPTIEEMLKKLGGNASEACVEEDHYYNHPSRDFRKTDEVLRIRKIGPMNRITYKGPKIDKTTKTRQEIDIPLPNGEEIFTSWFRILEALGFKPAGIVRKERRKTSVEWQNQTIEVALDKVEQLGAFVELELIAEYDRIAPAKACIQSLAKTLQLSGSERRSYLELLMEKIPSHTNSHAN